MTKFQEWLLLILVIIELEKNMVGYNLLSWVSAILLIVVMVSYFWEIWND